MLARQPQHQVGGGGGDEAGGVPQRGLVLLQPADFRPYGLAGELHQRVAGHGGGTQPLFQFIDFSAGAHVDAVQNAGAQRPHLRVQRQKAGADGADAQRRHFGRLYARLLQNALRQGADVGPPDGVSVLFHMAGMRQADAVRRHRRLHHLALQVGQRRLAAVGSYVNAEQVLFHRDCAPQGKKGIVRASLNSR